MVEVHSFVSGALNTSASPGGRLTPFSSDSICLAFVGRALRLPGQPERLPYKFSKLGHCQPSALFGQVVCPLSPCEFRPARRSALFPAVAAIRYLEPQDW